MPGEPVSNPHVRLSWREDNFGGVETLELDLDVDIRVPRNAGYRFLSDLFDSVDGYETDSYTEQFLLAEHPDWREDFLRLEEEYGLEPLLDRNREYRG